MNKKNQCYIIAEASLNHNGSIKIAKKLIDVTYGHAAHRLIKFFDQAV